MKVVLTLGPGISAEQTAFDDFELKSYLTGKPLVSNVWAENNTEKFFDFKNKNAKDLWKIKLTRLSVDVPFDGLWLDMNEVTTMCDGECPSKPDVKNEKLVNSFLAAEEGAEQGNEWYQSLDNGSQSTYYMPFIPGTKNLDSHTLSLNASGVDYIELDSHSVFGMRQQIVTEETMDELFNTKRNFVSSRSTFAGSGFYGHHVLGSHFRNPNDMEYAIAGVMNFNMFGMPSTGPNICNPSTATPDETWEKDCLSWMRLATYLPFAKQ